MNEKKKKERDTTKNSNISNVLTNGLNPNRL